MFELVNGIRSIFEACMVVKLGERMLVIADNEGGPMWTGQLVMNLVNSMGAEAVMAVITTPKISGEEPPPPIAAAMKSVDAILYVSDNGSLVHTNARKEATAVGVRYYSIIQIPLDDLKEGVSVTDLRLIQKQTEKLAQRLTQAKVARLTTPFGTDITLSLAGREGIPLNPRSKIVSSLPDYAEAAIAPVEGTAEGIVVADLAVAGWGYLFRNPLRYTVKAGKIVDIAGDAQDTDRMHKIVGADENATNIAELGIGTSHVIPGPIRGSRRDAARLGTAHIGIGRNNDIGGETWSSIHFDTLMSQAIVELDDQCVLREAALLI
ncbi:aminopeptidase [Chloroflexota bacterium]